MGQDEDGDGLDRDGGDTLVSVVAGLSERCYLKERQMLGLYAYSTWHACMEFIPKKWEAVWLILAPLLSRPK